MASFFPNNNDPGANIIVTREEFNLFHNIDRQLFTRLVVNLGRDTSQSTHVMAFLLWLEKVSKNFKMIKSLLTWPDNLLSNLFDESLLALNCIENAQFPFDNNGLPSIQRLTQTTITLQYFYENRIAIIPGITRKLNDVCMRAFTDIVQQVQYQKALKDQQNFSAAAGMNFYGTIPNNNNNNPFMMQHVIYFNPASAVGFVPQPALGVPVVPQQWNIEGSSSSNANWSGGLALDPNSYDVANTRENFNAEFNEILARLQLSGGGGAAAAAGAGPSSEKREVVQSHDDRTIFMTFSKGYPISETEVREFFSRRYGDIIEALYMQDVPLPEQPLYARLVVRPAAVKVIDAFLGTAGKMKFSINGKHVWVRRYIRKGNKSPQTSSPVTSRPPSPSAAGTSF